MKVAQETKHVHEAGEETYWIPLKKIECLKPSARDRSYKKPVAIALSEDFKQNGQLHPIHVRPHPDPSMARNGCYQQITGLHRIEGQRIAGNDSVLCVIRAADDEEFAAIRAAENALRSNLSKDQQFRAVTLLNNFYESRWARQQEVDRETAIRERAREIAEAHAAEIEEARQGETNSRPRVPVKRGRPSRAKAPQEQQQAPRGIHDMVASILGVSKRTSSRVVRAAKIVETLTPEQRDVLFPPNKAVNNISNRDLEALVALDEEPRRKAISLAASGMKWREAILEHTPPPVVLDPPPRGEDEYPDQEWIETFCPRILPKLKNRAAFEVEACKWREFRKIRRKAAQAVSGIFSLWRNRKRPGLYERLLYQAWYVSHPNDWIPCGNCDAVGLIPIGSPKEKCPACDGGGFKLKIERWE